MAALDADSISLRPLSLRPGAGARPFASFAAGAGVGLKKVRRRCMRAPRQRKALIDAGDGRLAGPQAIPARWGIGPRALAARGPRPGQPPPPALPPRGGGGRLCSLLLHACLSCVLALARHVVCC